MNRKLLVRALLPLLIAMAAHAQQSGIDVRRQTPEEIADRLLALKGIHDVNAEARKSAKAKYKDEGKVWYDYERIEVTGIWAIDGDTDREFSQMFDHRITPSHLEKAPPNETFAQSLRRKYRNQTTHKKEDFRDLLEDRNGRLSGRGRSVMSPLRGKAIRQMVCHSWGTEIVYNAIFEGVIKAPQSIVVLGAPDDNSAKWKALAEHTGATIIYMKNTGRGGDIVAGAGTQLPDGMTQDPRLLDLLWKEQCESNASICNHSGPDGPGYFANVSGKTGDLPPGHDRIDYYRAFREKFPTFSESAVEMREPQELAVRTEAARIKKDALQEAQRLVASAIPDDRAVPDPEPGSRVQPGDMLRLLQDIKSGATQLEARKERERWERALKKRNPGPSAAPKLPQAAPDDPWEDAKHLAAASCDAPDAWTQERIDKMMERLREYMKGKAFWNMPATTCADQVFVKMVILAPQGKRLSAAWIRARARNKYCVEAAKDDTDLVYRGLSALARKACGGQGLGSSEIYDVFAGARTDRDPYRPLSDHSKCEQEVYYLLCVGDPDGDSWEASTINQKARELASAEAAPQGGDPHGGGSSNGGSDRTERLESHDFSRPNALIPTIRTPRW